VRTMASAWLASTAAVGWTTAAMLASQAEAIVDR